MPVIYNNYFINTGAVRRFKVLGYRPGYCILLMHLAGAFFIIAPVFSLHLLAWVYLCPCDLGCAKPN